MTKSELYYLKKGYKIIGEKKCLNCGKEFKIFILRDYKRKNFCCKICTTTYYCQLGIIAFDWTNKRKARFVKQKMRGERPNIQDYKNHNYKDGKTICRKRLIRSGIKRKCYYCHNIKNLIAHHIDFCIRKKDIGRSIIKGNHELKNLQWVCSKCHKKIHLSKNNKIL